MNRVFSFILILSTSFFFHSCAGSEDKKDTAAPATDPPAEQSSLTKSEDMHPCERLVVDDFASLIGQSVEEIELRKEDLGNEICAAYILGDNDDSSYDDLLVFQLDFMKSKDGFPDFNQAIINLITAGTFTLPAGIDKGKSVPVREVNVGDKAYIYSAQDYTTLMMHVGNEVRYTLTFFRQVGNDGMYEGLKFSPSELEAKLVELGRTLE